MSDGGKGRPPSSWVRVVFGFTVMVRVRFHHSATYIMVELGLKRLNGMVATIDVRDDRQRPSENTLSERRLRWLVIWHGWTTSAYQSKHCTGRFQLSRGDQAGQR